MLIVDVDDGDDEDDTGAMSMFRRKDCKESLLTPEQRPWLVLRFISIQGLAAFR